MSLPLEGAIDILLDFGATETEQIANFGVDFSEAEAFWESKLTGYRDAGFAAPWQVSIEVGLTPIDGLGGVLAEAGPTSVNPYGRYAETTQGVMNFDTADLLSMQQNETLAGVVRHEMGHVLGFGSLWSMHGVYLEGSGQYIGAAGLLAFREEFNQPNANFVPVELDGGAGTANGHWNMGIDLGSQEALNSNEDPGDSIVYTSVKNGETLDNELMTGFLSGSTWLSNTTLQSFRDIGYTVVPEPAAYALWIGFLCICRAFASRSKAGNSAA